MTAPAPVPIEQWPGLVVGDPVAEGDRSQVWRGELAGQPVAIRRSTHSLPSLAWELQLLVDLDAAGFLVPVPEPTADGHLHWQEWNVQSWLDGREPRSAAEWQTVSVTLRQIHRRFRGYRQRPGMASVLDLAEARRSVAADLDRTPPEVVATCLAHFEPYLGAQRSLIHGDPHPGNLRIDDLGRVGLLDWDEARVDVVDLDLSNLGGPVLHGRRREAAEAMANAWEALNGWLIESRYARSRFDQLPSQTGSSASQPIVLEDGLVTLRATTEVDVETRGQAADGLRHSLGIFLAASPQPLIGNLDINFVDIDLELDEVDLSCGVFGPWRRQGYGAAALTLVLDYLHRVDRPEKPTLKIDPQNEASLALAHSLGFVEVRSVTGRDGELLVLQSGSAT